MALKVSQAMAGWRVSPSGVAMERWAGFGDGKIARDNDVGGLDHQAMTEATAMMAARRSSQSGVVRA